MLRSRKVACHAACTDFSIHCHRCLWQTVDESPAVVLASPTRAVAAKLLKKKDLTFAAMTRLEGLFPLAGRLSRHVIRSRLLIG